MYNFARNMLVATAAIGFCGSVLAAELIDPASPPKNTRSSSFKFSATPVPDPSTTTVSSDFATSTSMLLTGSPGVLDPSFDSDGKLTIDFQGTEAVSDMAVQPDGKIVAVGWLSTSSFFVARLNSDGSFDSTFQGGGAFAVGGGYDFSNKPPIRVALQGSSIVVSTTYDQLVNGSTTNYVYATRFNTYGQLDTSFASNGVFTHNYGRFNNVTDLVIDSSSRIVLAGYLSNNTNADFFVARLTSAGLVDSSFGSYGYRTTDFSSGSSDLINAIGLQSDGRIVAVGYTYNPTTPNWAIARYTTSGNLDYSFGFSGKTIINLSNSTDIAKDVAIQSDDKIVILGDALFNPRYMAMLRLNSTATAFDSSFNGNGQVYFGNWLGQTDIFPAELRVQSDGKIDAAATVVRTTRDFALYRVNSDGSYDVNFGGGAYLFDFAGEENVGDFVLQPDGKLLMGGSIDSDLLFTRHFN